MADKFNEPGRAAEAARSAENGESMLSPEKIQEVLTELVKAQEEQRRRIDSLTADNASLRAENRSLREKVDELSKESLNRPSELRVLQLNPPGWKQWQMTRNH